MKFVLLISVTRELWVAQPSTGYFYWDPILEMPVIEYATPPHEF